ncbi:MAG: transporter ATP-binding protein [Anaerocolumna sp.]|jgi:ABC-type multidrug transport system ATPase subunit|nr:transporter ATP-binding protein [Anaerocolumna sp.]
MQDSIIKVKDLTKKFNSKIILDHINLDFKKGETVAFTGENGSGKSTMLKIIAGLMKATNGEIIVDKNLKISYIPDRFDKINMLIPEYLYYIGKIDGLSSDEIQMITKELYSLFYLDDMLKTPMKYLSKGTLQKVAVLQALLVKPDILLLDEPLSGQDYMSQKNFITKMLLYKKQQVTILMSCHEQLLIDQLADRVYKINQRTFVEVMDTNNKRNTNKHMMSFRKQSSESTILKAYEEKHDIMVIENKDNIQIIVNKGDSQEILLNMLKAGFTLIKYEEI